jgi:hypothetical protein
MKYFLMLPGFLSGLLLLAPAGRAAGAGAPVEPLPRAHAHNDYEHARPLLDALEHGFCSVEADVWLVDDELRVAHDLERAKPGRTLSALYLEPLRQRVEGNQGRVYPQSPGFTLMIDVKSDATNTYVALRRTLQRYEKWLTRFQPERTITNAITVLVSGNRARALMASERDRLAGFDGRLEDLDGSESPHLIPLISDNWALHFRWRGRPEEGPLPAAEREKLVQWVARTHAQQRRIRFWGAPNTESGWRELYRAGVDLINTDDLAGLSEFLKRQR